jgi:hypothetical protein
VRRGFVVLLCALLLAACGNGNRLSRKEYARRADTICARYDRAAPAPETAVTTAGFTRLANRILPLLDRELAELRRLAPPKDEQQRATRWLGELRRARNDVVAIRARAQANDLQGVRALVQPAFRRLAAAGRLATRLGMHVCDKNR